MKLKQTLVIGAAVAVAAGSLTACRETPPDLPPAESMELPTFFDNSQAQQNAEAATAVNNVNVAALAVGAVTVALAVYTAAPRLMFLGTLQADPYKDGDEWVWDRTYPLLGVSGQLRGRLDNGLFVTMIVNGEREGINLDNFVWYEGEHHVGNGVWTLYAPEENGPVTSIDWEYNAVDDRTLIFTNTAVSSAGNGDTITYDITGTTASLEVYDVDDGSGVPAVFTVTWDTVDGSGMMDVNGDQYCWDTLENGQVDIPCQ